MTSLTLKVFSLSFIGPLFEILTIGHLLAHYHAYFTFILLLLLAIQSLVDLWPAESKVWICRDGLKGWLIFCLLLGNCLPLDCRRLRKVRSLNPFLVRQNLLRLRRYIELEVPLLQMISSCGWPRLLQEAMQSEKVHELNDEVADVLYNHGTYDLFFTFLQAIHHNLL